MSLPSQVLYTMKPEAVPSRATKTEFLSSAGAGAVGPGGQINIHINANRGEYLDPTNSVLRFTVNNTSANVMDVASHAASFIDRLEVYWGSTLLESISSYNVLFNALYDVSTNPMQRGMADSIIAGTAVSTAALNRTGRAIAGNAHDTFFIPLIGILGINCERYLPMGYGELRLVLTLAPTKDAVLYAGSSPATWTVSNVNYDADIIRLDASAQAMIEASLPDGQYIINSTSFRAFSGAISSQTNGVQSSLNMYVPGNFASCKTAYFTQRFSSYQTTTIKNSISDRTTNGFEKFYFRAGSTNYPPTPVTTTPMAFVELMKARHRWNTGDIVSCLDKGEYELQAHGSNMGSFVGGIDFESFANKGGVVMQGIDLTNSPLYFIAEYMPDADGALALTVDVFLEFDAVLSVDLMGSAMMRF